MDSKTQSLQQYVIQRCRKGDRRAQEQLYRQYVSAMYNICKRMMGNEESARDVLQDAFVQVFTRLDTLKEDKLFPAWIKQIVINRCINTLQKRKLDLVTLDDQRDYILEDEDNTEAIMACKINEIRQAIPQISEGCRTVLNLYVFEGYDHKEIAEILSISESTSKAQYCKAKSKLRAILNA